MKKILVQIDDNLITKYRCNKCGKIFDENYKDTVSCCRECHIILCKKYYEEKKAASNN